MKRRVEPAPDCGIIYIAECEECGHKVRKWYYATRFIREEAECEVCLWNASEAAARGIMAEVQATTDTARSL